MSSNSGAKGKPIANFINLIEGLADFAEQHSLGEIIGEIILKSGYKDYLTVSNDPTSQSRLENLKELKNMHHTGGAGLPAIREFLERVSLTASSDLPTTGGSQASAPADSILLTSSTGSDSAMAATNIQESNNTLGSITMMTLHLAKGLEFPTVFLTGFEEGLIPHYRSTEEREIDEERRLCYVGMTRAKETLYISRATRRSLFSNGDSFARPRPSSRFGKDLPEEVLESLGGDIKGYGFDENNGYDESYKFGDDGDSFVTSFNSIGVKNKFHNSNAGVTNFNNTKKVSSWSMRYGQNESDTYDDNYSNNKNILLQVGTQKLISQKLKFRNQNDIMNYIGIKKAQELEEDTYVINSNDLISVDEIEINTRVTHKTFGAGTVKEIELVEGEVSEDSKIKIEFDSAKVGVKRLIFKYAGLGLVTK